MIYVSWWHCNCPSVVEVLLILTQSCPGGVRTDRVPINYSTISTQPDTWKGLFLGICCPNTKQKPYSDLQTLCFNTEIELKTKQYSEKCQDKLESFKEKIVRICALWGKAFRGCWSWVTVSPPFSMYHHGTTGGYGAEDQGKNALFKYLCVHIFLHHSHVSRVILAPFLSILEVIT